MIKNKLFDQFGAEFRELQFSPLDAKQDGRFWYQWSLQPKTATPNDPDIIIMIIYILYKHNNNKKFKKSKMANFWPDPFQSGDQA